MLSDTVMAAAIRTPLSSRFVSLVLCVLMASCSSEKSTEPERDTIAPAQITDLAAIPRPYGIELAWVAPGDDEAVGMAHRYEIRFAATAITDESWELATPFSVAIPDPMQSGSRESFPVHGLDPFTLYYFAVRAADEAGNISSVSNSAEATTASSAPVRLTVTSSGTGPLDASWSPDGLTIAFSADWDGESRIYGVPSGGGVAEKLFGRDFRGTHPSWTREGSRFVFVVPGSYVETWSLQDGLPSKSSFYFAYPPVQDYTWGPVGIDFIYWVWVGEYPERFQKLFSGSLEWGQDPVKLRVAETYLDPDWSPNGESVLYHAFGDIWIIPPDGSGSEQILTNLDVGAMTGGAWSPDGRRIAFAAKQKGGSSDIWVVDSDGQNLIHLTVAEFDEVWPAWSPDGTQIAYTMTEEGRNDLWLIDLDLP